MQFIVVVVYFSFNRDLIKLFQLIQSAVPVVKHFVEIDELHCYLFNCFLCELFLVNLSKSLSILWEI